jgi:large conductance mechanosensitive channel
VSDEILEELRQIRKLLEPRPAPPPPPPPKGIIQEFQAFLKTFKVMGMAVAFIVGLYLGALVKVLVDDLIMPIIQFATPGSHGKRSQLDLSGSGISRAV